MRKLVLLLLGIICAVVAGGRSYDGRLVNFKAYSANHEWQIATSSIAGRFETTIASPIVIFERYYFMQDTTGGEWVETQNITLKDTNDTQTDWQFENGAMPGIYKIVATNESLVKQEYTIFLSTPLTDIYVTNSGGTGSVTYSTSFSAFLTVMFNAGAGVDSNEITLTDPALVIEKLKDGLPYTGNKISFVVNPSFNRIDLVVGSNLESGVFSIRISHPSSEKFGEFIIFNQKYENPPADNINDFLTVVLVFLCILGVIMFFLPLIALNMSYMEEQRKTERRLRREGAYDPPVVDNGPKRQTAFGEKKSKRERLRVELRQDAESVIEMSDVLKAEIEAAALAMERGLDATTASLDETMNSILEDSLKTKEEMAAKAEAAKVNKDKKEDTKKGQNEEDDIEESDDEEDEEDEEDIPVVKTVRKSKNPPPPPAPKPKVSKPQPKEVVVGHVGKLVVKGEKDPRLLVATGASQQSKVLKKQTDEVQESAVTSKKVGGLVPSTKKEVDPEDEDANPWDIGASTKTLKKR